MSSSSSTVYYIIVSIRNCIGTPSKQWFKQIGDYFPHIARSLEVGYWYAIWASKWLQRPRLPYLYLARVNVCSLSCGANRASPSLGISIYISLTRPVLNAYKWIVLIAALPAISLTL